MDISEIIGMVKGGALTIDAVTKAVKGVKEVLQKPDPAGDIDIPAAQNGLEKALDQALALKQLQLSLLDQLALLKAREMEIDRKLSKIEKFEEDEGNYVLTEVSLHSHAYVLQSELRDATAATYLCVPCFEEKTRSILQLKERDFGHDTIACGRCGFAARVPNELQAEYIPVRRTRGIWDDV